MHVGDASFGRGAFAWWGEPRLWSHDAERQGERSYAERWNESPMHITGLVVRRPAGLGLRFVVIGGNRGGRNGWGRRRWVGARVLRNEPYGRGGERVLRNEPYEGGFRAGSDVAASELKESGKIYATFLTVVQMVLGRRGERGSSHTEGRILGMNTRCHSWAVASEVGASG